MPLIAKNRRTVRVGTLIARLARMFWARSRQRDRSVGSVSSGRPALTSFDMQRVSHHRMTDSCDGR